MFRGDAAQTGVAAGELSSELALKWRFEAGGPIVSSPVIQDGRVFFGCDDGLVRALEVKTGKLLWSYKTEDVVEAPPMVCGDTVYVGSCDFFLYALDVETGKLRWKFETGDKIVGGACPVQFGSDLRVLCGSYDTKLYCLDSATGKEIWHYTTANYINGTPAVRGGQVVFGGCDAVLHQVSTHTGIPKGTIDLGEGCHVAGSVALADHHAYFGHYGNAFICIDLEVQEPRWSYTHNSQPFFSSPAIGPNRIIFGGRDKRLHCVDRKSGKELWSFLTRRKVDGSPVLVDSKVVFGSGDGWIWVLSAEDGSTLWSYEVGKPVLASPAVVDGHIFVGASDSHLYCFGPPATQSEKAKPTHPGRDKG